MLHDIFWTDTAYISSIISFSFKINWRFNLKLKPVILQTVESQMKCYRRRYFINLCLEIIICDPSLYTIGQP